MSKFLFPDGSIEDEDMPRKIEFEVSRDSDFAKMFDHLIKEHEKEVQKFEDKITKQVNDMVEDMFDTSDMSEEETDFLKDIANTFFRCGWNGCYMFHKERIERE